MMELPQTKHLGDPHNFNRSVRLANGKIIKPRCCIIESTFLGPSFRGLLDSIFSQSSISSPFTGLPKLHYQKTSPNEFEVNFVSSVESCGSADSVDWSQVGAMGGLLLWAGIDDLHHENLKLIETPSGLSILPIDIEAIFKKLPLLSATHLLPHAGRFVDIYGLSKIARKGMTEQCLHDLIHGFYSSIVVLNEHSQELNSHFLQEIGSDAIFRIILRETRSYYSHMRGSDLLDSLLPEEREQLSRGDIPYFFSKLGSEKVFYFTDSSLTYKEVAFNEITSKKSAFIKTANLGQQVETETIKNSVAQLIKWAAPMLIWTNKTTDLIELSENLLIVNLPGLDKFACKVQ